MWFLFVIFPTAGLAALAIYRLYLSPLAKFPGPRLAALTSWYEFYYDVILQGRYLWKIAELHEKYGPIVRITPHELHINDPDFLDTAYPQTRKVDRYAPYTRMTPANAAFAAVPHELHRIRRQPLNPFFSKQAVRRVEPVISALAHELCDKLLRYQDTGARINMVHAFAALTSDVISTYCFGQSSGKLREAEFPPDPYEMTMTLSRGVHALRMFWWLKPLMQQLPLSTVEKMSPAGYGMLQLQLAHESHIDAVRQEAVSPDPTRSVFHAMLADPDLPEDQKRTKRLVDEAMNFLGGIPSISHVLKMVAYQILAHPVVLQTLCLELQTALPDPTAEVGLSQVEMLPYLAAVITEGHRLAYGLIPRSQRVHREPLIYKEWVIPTGTPVGMTSKLTHDNPRCFPEPTRFQPERWLGPQGKALRRYFVGFGRGTRSCLGQNLATAELYIAIAILFRRLGSHLQLDGVVRERDIDISHDFLNTSPRLDSPGVFLVVTK